MIQFLDKKFLKSFKSLEDESIPLPEGMNQEQVDVMTRVLMATQPSDIEDISTEAIIGCFQFVECFDNAIGKETIYDDNALLQKVTELQSMQSVRKRRLL